MVVESASEVEEIEMAAKDTKGAMEKAATLAWSRWGNAWSMATKCSSCGEVKLCKGKRRARMLCLECWDEKGGA
jgi:hypothetical protein